MMDWTRAVGRVLVAVDGVTRASRYAGECFGYVDRPTYLVTKADGTRDSVVDSLARIATDSEELAYWRERALLAEGRQP